MHRRRFLQATGLSIVAALGTHPAVTLGQDLPPENPNPWPERLIVRGIRDFTRKKLELRWFADVFDSEASAKLEFDRVKAYRSIDFWLQYEETLMATEVTLKQEIGTEQFAYRMIHEFYGDNFYVHLYKNNVAYALELK